MIQSDSEDYRRFAPGQPKINKLRTECFRCGVCCIKFQAPLNAKEVRRVAAFLGIEEVEFICRFTDSRWQGKEKLLLHQNGACSFLHSDASGKINNCRIHQVRPGACSEWVAGPDKRECREGLSKHWRLSFSDSGQLEGSEEQITEFQSFVESLGSDSISGSGR